MKWFVRTLIMLLALTALGGRADAQPKPAEQWTVPTLRADELKSRPGTVTSEQLGKNRLYLVGITKGEIFHLLVLLSNKSEVINTLEIRYPETSKSRFKAIAKRVVASFHAGHSEWYEHCCK